MEMNQQPEHPMMVVKRQLIPHEKKRFYGHKVLKCKYSPIVPDACDRAYYKIADAYLMLLRDTIEKGLPEIKKSYREEINRKDSSGVRLDDMTSLSTVIKREFEKMQVELSKKMSEFGLIKKLDSMATLTRKLTVEEWKKAVKSTMGIDIFSDYYMGDFYKDMMQEWVVENVSLIKTIPADALKDMQKIVEDGFQNGTSTTAMVKMISNRYGMGKRHAWLIARDQVAKLNEGIQKAQQLDAGIKKYVWRTSGDAAVRPSHAALNGKTFSWTSGASELGGLNPGEDYQCRCIAEPVFDQDDVTLPIAREMNNY